MYEKFEPDNKADIRTTLTSSFGGTQECSTRIFMRLSSFKLAPSLHYYSAPHCQQKKEKNRFSRMLCNKVRDYREDIREHFQPFNAHFSCSAKHGKVLSHESHYEAQKRCLNLVY